MARLRKPFQGVLNIIRFNAHFYILAMALIFALLIFYPRVSGVIQVLALGFIVGLIAVLSISLIVSYYIYDVSRLYQLDWLQNIGGKKLLNINAGFDEISEIIKEKYPNCELINCDFYDARMHTEVSIKRARKYYPPSDSTIQVSTDRLPFSDESFDISLAILSAHEIRNEKERISFFSELYRVTNTSGQVYVTEHLRDMNNFLAYTIGFFHFHSKSTWLKTFEESNFTVKAEIRTTPFISTFILEKNGDTL